MVHPTLSIMDAVVGMEGNGPAHGLPRHIGAIIAAENGLDVDLTACRLINLNYNRVRLLNRALERKVGNANLEIIGDSLQNLLVKDFKLPGNAYLEIIPPFLTRYFLDKIRSYPSCTSEKCIACGMCRDSCPASAININDDCNGITINPTICIQCMCCQELCPEGAIMLKPTSLLGKLAARLGGRL